ncbi:DNA methyltransferase [Fervidicoccus fontis]|uniref:Type II methyltransferase n=1 Tax=Fervidicoccus fontis (strain DSM 19380 / JCM 18336 / VKM B-2539 / Kam940) TaxID=1163730 RepID=I0A1J8_FERFK|nr:DNA methyltransferase [Fervidicoccus fontis]AFH42855.1 DNA methylase N-4/N-6 [Fervidicoccus fontis Kam940]
MSNITELNQENAKQIGLQLRRPLKEITLEDFESIAKRKKYVTIGCKKIELEIEGFKELQPKEFVVEKTSVWSFPERGKWATHKYNAKFRGNWSPQVARNLLLLYSKSGDTVLDPFLGSGTSMIECILLKRRCYGVDINIDSVMLSWSRIKPIYSSDSFVKLFEGDAEYLDAFEDEKFDFILGHPPYASIIKYSKGSDGDLSKMSIQEYLEKMRRIARELYRILKKDKYLAIMVGDIRRKKHVIPLGYMVMKIFLEEGFIIKEHIIKVQHNMIGTAFWKNKKNDFLLLKHEHIFVFRKPLDSSDYEKFQYYMLYI